MSKLQDMIAEKATQAQAAKAAKTEESRQKLISILMRAVSQERELIDAESEKAFALVEVLDLDPQELGRMTQDIHKVLAAERTARRASEGRTYSIARVLYKRLKRRQELELEAARKLYSHYQGAASFVSRARAELDGWKRRHPEYFTEDGGVQYQLPDVEDNHNPLLDYYLNPPEIFGYEPESEYDVAADNWLGQMQEQAFERAEQREPE